MAKRIFDILFSLLSIILFSPFCILISIAIKLDSKGPIFYRGERIGKNGNPFRIFKFRTMIQDADKNGRTTTSASDERLTNIGRIIRKFKLDELPQLLNVLQGTMSIVGPRPQVKWAIEKYNDEEKQILQLKPGITDWASIKFHNEEEIIASSGIADPDEAYMKLIHNEKTQLQLKYLHERNFFLDIKIILVTISMIFYTKILGKPYRISKI
jgi:lipopolysaccharide/colanic/teichoic acid biosynthesis glycosyltransferase